MVARRNRPAPPKTRRNSLGQSAPYSQFKDWIAVDVCVVREIKPDLFSKCIQSMFQSKYSHIYIEYKNEVFHSSDKGVARDPIEEAVRPGFDEIMGRKTIRLRCTEEEFYDHFKKHDHIEYDMTGVPGHSLTFLGRIGQFLARLFQNGRKKARCHEYVCWVLHDLGGRYDLVDTEFSGPRAVFEAI